MVGQRGLYGQFQGRPLHAHHARYHSHHLLLPYQFRHLPIFLFPFLFTPYLNLPQHPTFFFIFHDRLNQIDKSVDHWYFFNFLPRKNLPNLRFQNRFLGLPF